MVAKSKELGMSFQQENDPAPLRPEDRKRLTWEDATERFLDAAEIKADEWPSQLSRLRTNVFWPVINAGMGAQPLLPPLPFVGKSKAIILPSIDVSLALTGRPSPSKLNRPPNAVISSFVSFLYEGGSNPRPRLTHLGGNFLRF